MIHRTYPTNQTLRISQKPNAKSEAEVKGSEPNWQADVADSETGGCGEWSEGQRSSGRIWYNEETTLDFFCHKNASRVKNIQEMPKSQYVSEDVLHAVDLV